MAPFITGLIKEDFLSMVDRFFQMGMPVASEETSLRSTPAEVSVVEKMNTWLLMWAEVLDTTFKRSKPDIKAQRDDWCFKRSVYTILAHPAESAC